MVGRLPGGISVRATSALLVSALLVSALAITAVEVSGTSARGGDIELVIGVAEPAEASFICPALICTVLTLTGLQGCSAGEELYSLAILFREEGLESRTMFYATDINTEALRRAEAGVYDLDRVAQFTESHRRAGGKSSLSDYYTAAYGNAVFDKSLRRRAVFSDHSLATDAVFAEVHLVCCRNVLIYFDRELQDRAVGLFKDALVRKGFLGLGAKESLHFSAHAGAFAEYVRERAHL